MPKPKHLLINIWVGFSQLQTNSAVLCSGSEIFSRSTSMGWGRAACHFDFGNFANFLILMTLRGKNYSAVARPQIHILLDSTNDYVFTTMYITHG